MASKYFDQIEVSPEAKLYVERMFRRLDRSRSRKVKVNKAIEKRKAAQ